MNQPVLFAFVIVIIALCLYLLVVIMLKRLFSLCCRETSGLLCCKATYIYDIEKQEYDHYCDCCYRTYGWNNGYYCCC